MPRKNAHATFYGSNDASSTMGMLPNLFCPPLGVSLMCVVFNWQ